MTLDRVLLSMPTILAADAQQARSWVQLARTGKFVSNRYGSFEISREDLSQMLHNWREVTPKAPTQLPIDYDHLSMDPKKPMDGAAAGWIENLQLRASGEELWGEVSWTPKAADAIANREYRFISPSFVKNHKHKDGTEIGTTLLAAAVTNHPFLEKMAALSLYRGRDLPWFNLSNPETIRVSAHEAINLSAIHLAMAGGGTAPGQRVMIAPGNARTQDEIGATLEIAEVVGDGDDAFVSLKDANGMIHKWFRATELLPASAVPANPQHPGLVPGAAPTVPVQAGLPGAPGAGLPGQPGAAPNAGAMVNPTDPNTPGTDPAAPKVPGVPNPDAAAGADAAGAEGDDTEEGADAEATDEETKAAKDGATGDAEAESADGEDPAADPAAAASGLTPEQVAAQAAAAGLPPEQAAAQAAAAGGADKKTAAAMAKGAAVAQAAHKGAQKANGAKGAAAKAAKNGLPPPPAPAPGAVPAVPGAAVAPVPGAGLPPGFELLPEPMKKAIAAAMAASNPQKGMHMKFQLNNDKGEPIEVTDAQLEAAGVKIVKDGETVIAKTDLTELQGKVTSLSSRLDQTEKDKSYAEMTAELARLSRGAFITKPERDWAEKTWKDAKDLSGFKEWAATKTTAVVSLNKEHGSSGRPESSPKTNGEQAQEKLITLSRQIAKEEGLSLRDATIKAGTQLADEAEAYREQYAEA